MWWRRLESFGTNKILMRWRIHTICTYICDDEDWKVLATTKGRNRQG
jgi:hypothetical protein